MTPTTAAPPVFLHTRIEKKQILVFLTNTADVSFQGRVRYVMERTDGRVRGETADAVKAKPHETVQLIFFDRRELHERKELLRMELFDGSGALLQRTRAQGKGLKPPRLCDPKLEVSVFLRAGQIFVSVRAACFAEDIRLLCDGYTFSDNGFSLFANEEKTVELLGAKADFCGTPTATSAFDRR